MIQKTIRLPIIFSVCALTLAACGNRPGERAVSGAALGAAGGAGVAAIAGGNPVAGAVVGGVGGAVVGAVTAPDRRHYRRRRDYYDY